MAGAKFSYYSKFEKTCSDKNVKWGSRPHIYELFNQSNNEEILGYAIGIYDMSAPPHYFNIPQSQTGAIVGPIGDILSQAKESGVFFEGSMSMDAHIEALGVKEREKIYNITMETYHEATSLIKNIKIEIHSDEWPYREQFEQFLNDTGYPDFQRTVSECKDITNMKTPKWF